eukprot:2929302-Amphidinium_carterae.1
MSLPSCACKRSGHQIPQPFAPHAALRYHTGKQHVPSCRSSPTQTESLAMCSFGNSTSARPIACEEDFMPSAAATTPWPMSAPVNEVPVGALGLSPHGLLKLRQAIQAPCVMWQPTIAQQAIRGCPLVSRVILMS